jgi:DNA-binding CsgD family transcriptional regulator
MVDAAGTVTLTATMVARADAGLALVELSARELDVLRLVAEGFRDREIADRLFVSRHTVANHVRNALLKIGAPSRAAAVAHAYRQGLL